MKILRTIDGDCGEHISNFAGRLLSRWQVMSEYNNVKDFTTIDDFAIKGTFNGTSLIVTKDSTVESILKDYNDQLEIAHQKYINSDEYKERQIQEKIELTRLNKESENLMNVFNTLDFNDYKQVLFWLCKIQPYSDRIGVNVPKDKIFNKLLINGYKVNVNCEEDFNEEDPENFARYIIGQCMNGLDRIGAIHYMAVRFTEDWKKRYCA